MVETDLQFEALRMLLDKPVTYQTFAKLAGMEWPQAKELLADWEARGLVVRDRTRYQDMEAAGYLSGRLQVTSSGAGWLIMPEDEPDVYIPHGFLETAVNGDTVLVRLAAKYGRPEGTVIKVLKRAHEAFSAVLFRTPAGWFARPDDDRIAPYVPVTLRGGGEEGDRVWLRITNWSPVRGKVEQVLGDSADPSSGIEALMLEYGLPGEFPREVLQQAEQLPQTVDFRGECEDLRSLRTFTIDSEDAKDLDDAVSIQVLEDGWRLGVHIADVSRYVAIDSVIDREGHDRATSVYFPGRVIPMLPTALSNGICSLNGNVDRYTLNVFMDFNRAGACTACRFCEGVIHSHMRMNYRQVSAYLEGGDETAAAQLGSLTADLKEMEKLARLLEHRRDERGAIDFNVYEPYFKLNEKGEPTDVYRRPRHIADRLIESFMIAANEAVAKYMVEKGLAACFRVHEKPEGERLYNFRRFALSMGYTMPMGIPTQEDLKDLLRRAKGKPEENGMNRMMLRAMSKARYAPENLGHYGLGSTYYCHFTSPIRRYPDLLVHRMLRECLRGEMTVHRADWWREHMQSWSDHCSQREVNAEQAERDGDKLFCCCAMKDRIGETFTARVSGVCGYGVYVELDNTVEGLVSTRALGGSWDFDAESMTLQGMGRRVIALGDVMRVRLTKVDVTRRLIDFEPEEALFNRLTPPRPVAPKSKGGKKVRAQNGKKARPAGKKHRRKR